MVGGTGQAGAIAMENGCVTVMLPLVACSTPVNVPAWVGVPLMTPLAAMASPFGNAPELRLTVGAGAPVVVTVKLYGICQVPPVGGGLVIANWTSGCRNRPIAQGCALAPRSMVPATACVAVSMTLSELLSRLAT